MLKNSKNYPCLPGQTHPRPLNVEIPMADFEATKRKLDAAQKECIRIADLYRHDKARLEHELDRLVAMLDHGEITAQESAQMQTLKAENETLKKMNADLQGRLAAAETKLERILDTLTNWRKSETPEEIRIRKGIIVELEKGYCPNRADPTRK